MLEVDLEYPDELHKLHNDCPLASVHRILKFKQSHWLKKCIGFNKDKKNKTKKKKKCY